MLTVGRVDTILQRHFNSVKQFTGWIIDDIAHPLHSDLISAKSSRPMRRISRLMSSLTSAFQASVLPFLARHLTCEETEIQKLRLELSS
ncbi:hypothetical protein SprV_0401675400 [Sparganum proliferum]